MRSLQMSILDEKAGEAPLLASVEANSEVEFRMLLEYAARAAGHEFLSTCVSWDPINDDAISFKLMVHLGINVLFNDDMGNVTVDFQFVESPFVVVVADYSDFQDKYAACRFAIVRAAAEMGWMQ